MKYTKTTLYCIKKYSYLLEWWQNNGLPLELDETMKNQMKKLIKKLFGTIINSFK